MKLAVYHSDGVYALYVDGILDTGPSEEYHINERIYQLLDIEAVADSAFLYAGPHGEPAQVLDEVREYVSEREQRNRRAADLEAAAADLQAKARELRS